MATHGHIILIILGCIAVQVTAFMAARKWVDSVRCLLTEITTHPLPPAQRTAALAILPWVAELDDRAGVHGLSPSTVSEAIVELELATDDRWEFAILHRSSVLAPLLGVLITSGEFLRIGLQEFDGESLEMATLVLPLILGVGAGASLAVLNQFLLLFLRRSTAFMLSAARRWLRQFESAFDQSQRADNAQYGELTSAIREHIGVMRRNSETMEAALSGFEITSQGLSDFGRSLSHSIARVPASLSGIADAAERSTAALDRAVKTSCEAADRMNAAIARFECCVRENLVPAAERQEQVSRGLNAFISDATSLRETLAAAANELWAAVMNQRELTQQVQTFFVKDAEQHREHMTVMEARVDDAVRHIAALCTQLHNATMVMASEVTSGGAAFNAFSKTVTAFDQVIHDQIRSALAAFLEAADCLSSSTQHTAVILRELHKSIPALGESVEIQRESIELFRDSVEKLTVPTHQALSKAAVELNSGSEDLTESIKRFREFLVASAGEVKRMLPVLESSVHSLNPAAMEFREAVEGQLMPSLKLQQSLLESQSDAIESVTEQLRSLAVSAASLTAEVSARRQADCDVREATRKLHEATSQLANAVESGFAPVQGNFVDAVTRLGPAITGLQQLLTSGSHSLDSEIGNLNQVVQSMTSLLVALREVRDFASPDGTPQQLLIALNTVARSLDQLPSRISDAVAKVAATGENGKRLGLFSSLFKRT